MTNMKNKIKDVSKNLKPQSVLGKKQKQKQEWEERLELIFNILKNMYDNNVDHVAMQVILQKANLILEKNVVIGINARLKNYLRKDKGNVWALDTRRSKGKTLYKLVRYGRDEDENADGPEI